MTMKRERATSMTTLLIAAAVVSALSGCTFEVTLPPAEPSTATSTTPPAETETPESTPEPVALSVPGCNELLTLAQARSVLDAPTAVLIAEEPANEYSPWYYAPKPSVVSAIAGLTVGSSCWWGVPNSDYGFTVLVGVIDAATRSSIEPALTAEGFSSTVVGARTVYALEDNEADTAESHEFIGDVWILSNGPDLDLTGVAADYAFEAMLAANPGLGR
jgi:hypothetical protein